MALAVAGGLAALFLVGRGTVDVGSRQEGTPVPNLAFADYEGRRVALADFRGKPAVINTWASWCPFCVDEISDFAALQEEFGDKMAVILINRAESSETAKKFSDQIGVTGRITLLLDPSDSFYRAIGGFSMPETILVDENGFIKDHKRGPMSLEEMRRRVMQAFNL